MAQEDKVLPCQYLRSKEMYHSSGGSDEDLFASGSCWCSKSQEDIGPDGGPADAEECTPDRKCYV